MSACGAAPSTQRQQVPGAALAGLDNRNDNLAVSYCDAVVQAGDLVHEPDGVSCNSLESSKLHELGQLRRHPLRP